MPPHVVQTPMAPKWPLALSESTHFDLRTAVRSLLADFPDSAHSFDPDSGLIVVLSPTMSEMEHVLAHVRKGVPSLVIGQTQVAYREMLTRAATIDYSHKKITQPRGPSIEIGEAKIQFESRDPSRYQFARVKIAFEPLPEGSGFVFESEIVGGAIPGAFIPGVEAGIRSVAHSGPLLGFPVVDFKARLIDGAYHDVDSSELAFEIAARMAFREASEKAEMSLLSRL